MTIAELRGKISDAGINLSERMEDLLTADIFGCMRYVPAEKFLLPFLGTACSFRSRNLPILQRVVTVHYAFWPWLKSPGRIPCEPDVAIGVETERGELHLILVECKYYSELSSGESDEMPEPNDQLARELDNLDVVTCEVLGWRPRLYIISRSLLFVTQDMGLPKGLLAKSLAEYGRKRHRDGDIFWTSWRFAPTILESALATENIPEHRAVMEDMLHLLLRKELVMFQGIEAITGDYALPEFYHALSHRYVWADVPVSLAVNYEFEVGK